MMRSFQLFSQNNSEIEPEKNAGLFAAYGRSGQIGLRFDISPAIILRPAISLSSSHLVSEWGTGSDYVKNTDQSVSAGLEMDILYNFSINLKTKDINFYTGLGIGYGYQETKTERYQSQFPSQHYLNINRALSLQGFIGTEYHLNTRFIVFGETGLYLNDLPDLKNTRRNYGTFSEIGIIFLF